MKKRLFFRGGLGNQLFQYAYYLYLKKTYNIDLLLDCYAPSMIKKYGFQLREIFPAISKNKDFLPYIKTRPLYLLLDGLKKAVGLNFFLDNPPLTQKEFPSSKIYIRGLWPEYRFLDEMREEILKNFTFTDIPESEVENQNILPLIKNSTSVSLHIRRGNYLKPKQRLHYGYICDLDYYKQSVKKIKELVSDPVFFIFSNDIDWVKDNLDLSNAHFIDWNTKDASFRDMQLMSYCKHNIIANSTFSWWAAWLNQHPDKIVLTPDKWLHNVDDSVFRKLIPESWVKIPVYKPYVVLFLPDNTTKADLENILKQTYSDFILLTKDNFDIEDKRIRSTANPEDGYTFLELNKKQIKEFNNKKYLQKLLTQV